MLAARRTRRGIGLLVVAGGVGLALWFVLVPRPDARDVATRRGIGFVLEGVAGGPAALASARDAFRDALRAAPFDPYPAFLLHLTERLDSPATIDPDRGPFDRALALIRAGRIEDARLLLMRPGVALAGGPEALLLRFLHDAAVFRSAGPDL